MENKEERCLYVTAKDPESAIIKTLNLQTNPAPIPETLIPEGCTQYEVAISVKPYSKEVND